MSGRHAILIGVDGYAFQPLASAVNDAVALREELLGKATPGLAPLFAASEITLLTTPAEGDAALAGTLPATRDNVLNELKAYYEADEPLDFLLVFFAGHGVMVSADGRTRQTLILPSDVHGPEDGRNMISLSELLEVFAERGPRQQLWIVDACRDMPYQRRPRGYELEWNERDTQGQRAQVAIHAVAPGGTALSEAGGQGRLTGHLLKGLAGSGAAVDYVPGHGHCVTAPSLHDYAKRRVVEVLAPYDDWTRAVQTPQIYQNGPPLSPLRDVPAPEPRPFRVEVKPPEAAAALELALEVQYGIPTPGWPPRALPRVYELRATLRVDMTQAGWGEPKPSLVAVDVREQESVDIEVPRSAPPEQSPRTSAVTSGKGVAPLNTMRHTRAPDDSSRHDERARFDGLGGTDHFHRFRPPARRGEGFESLLEGRLAAALPAPGSAPADASVSIAEFAVTPMATLRVRSADSAASVRLRRAQAPWDEREAPTDAAISLEPGVWDVKVGFGDYTSSATRVVLGAGDVREIEAMAQITPTTAALMPPHLPLSNAASVRPSESIGPMQGAVLPTLLPLLALKTFDHNQQILHQFAHLRIRALAPAEWPSRPFAVALALEGHHGDPTLTVVDGEEIWRDEKAQVALFVGSQRGARGTLSLGIGKRRVDIAAPHVAGAVTVVTVTAWPNGRMDYSVCLFRLPVGASFAGAPGVTVGKISRALAIATPLFRAGARLDNVSDSLLFELAHAKWLDPVLGALAYHAHAHRLAALEADSPEASAQRSLRATIARNLAAHFPELPDSRIIAALAGEGEQRHQAFRALLADAELGQPVLVPSLAHLANAALEHGNLQHFAIERMDRVVPGEVFNAIRIT